MKVYEDGFIKIEWNESATFNVFFAIGGNDCEYREVDIFTTMEKVTEKKAIELARQHAQECKEILETNPTAKA